MEIKIEEVKRIESGKHVGKITAVEYREKPYEYTDIVLELADGYKLKAGYPTKITPESKLGKLLLDFGASLEVGKSIDPAKYLVNKGCSFLVEEDGKFMKVIPSSVKPVQ